MSRRCEIRRPAPSCRAGDTRCPGSSPIHRDSVRVGLTAQSPRHRALLRKFVVELIVQVAILGALFAIEPWLALGLFIVPNLLHGLLVWWEAYPHHLNVPGKDVYDASITVDDSSYNLMTFNIGHHTAHHQKPTLHWSLLPLHTAKIRHRIPDSCIQRELATIVVRATTRAAARRA